MCHDSSMYYTLSHFSSTKQHFFGRVTTLARNRLFSENTVEELLRLRDGSEMCVCVCVRPPTVSPRHTKAHTLCTNVQVYACVYKHTSTYLKTSVICMNVLAHSSLHTTLSQSLTTVFRSVPLQHFHSCP